MFEAFATQRNFNRFIPWILGQIATKECNRLIITVHPRCVLAEEKKYRKPQEKIVSSTAQGKSQLQVERKRAWGKNGNERRAPANRVCLVKGVPRKLLEAECFFSELSVSL